MKKIEKPLDDILLKAIDETLSSEKLKFLNDLAWFEYMTATERKDLDPFINKYIKEALDKIRSKKFNIPISKKEKRTLLLFFESGYLEGGTSEEELYFIHNFFKKMPKNLNEYLKKDVEVPKVLKKLVKQFKNGT